MLVVLQSCNLLSLFLNVFVMPLPIGIKWQYSSLTNCREHFQTCWVLYPGVKYFAPILSFGYWHCQHLI